MVMAGVAVIKGLVRGMFWRHFVGSLRFWPVSTMIMFPRYTLLLLVSRFGITIIDRTDQTKNYLLQVCKNNNDKNNNNNDDNNNNADDINNDDDNEDDIIIINMMVKS